MGHLNNTGGEYQLVTEGVEAGEEDDLSEIDVNRPEGISYARLIVTLGVAGALFALAARGDSNKSPRQKSNGELRSDDERLANNTSAVQNDVRMKTLGVPESPDHSKNLGQV